MKTTYIVSGHMRTGTSMMMHALEAGGLQVVKSDKRDGLRKNFKDKYYDPNKCGLYELTDNDYRDFRFPMMYEGKVIKCMWYYLPNLIAGNYKVVFMMRNPEEVRQSYMAFFNQSNLGSLENFKERMKIAINRLKVRNDIEVIVFQYREVVENPNKHFQILKDNGWEIDIKKASSVIDPKLCRYKIEELEIGVV